MNIQNLPQDDNNDDDPRFTHPRPILDLPGAKTVQNREVTIDPASGLPILELPQMDFSKKDDKTVQNHDEPETSNDLPVLPLPGDRRN